MKDILLIIV